MAGAQRQQELLTAAGTMRLLGPNTIGLVNLTRGIPLSASSALEMDHFPVGSIGIVSQSGGIVGSLLSRAAARGIGLSSLVSTSRSEEHTSELQSLMRTSYAVFCLKKKNNIDIRKTHGQN